MGLLDGLGRLGVIGGGGLVDGVCGNVMVGDIGVVLFDKLWMIMWS